MRTLPRALELKLVSKNQNILLPTLGHIILLLRVRKHEVYQCCDGALTNLDR